MEGLTASSEGAMPEPSSLASLLGFVALVYYIAIWSISLLGLRQAQTLFGKPASKQSINQLPVLPLRNVHSSPPLSPPSSPETLRNPQEEAERRFQSGVSILRPLAGLDHNLASNLASAFEQKYPRDLFEIILSVRDENDQALPVAKRICARYPDVQSRIIIGDEPAGVNPKICNLVRPYACAQFDILWTLDAQVQMPPDALARAVVALQDKPRQPAPTWMNRLPHGGENARVGLVHHVPLGVTPNSTSMGSHIEAIFLSTNHAKMYLAINALSLESCVMGKSNLYRKSDLANVPDSFFNVGAEGTRGERGAIGSIAFSSAERPREFGWNESTSDSEDKVNVSAGAARPLARFSIYLAEDNMLATSLWKPPMNLAHTLVAHDVARTSVGEVKSLADYWNRRVRWIRVRRHMVPAATYLEPFTESIVCGTIATTALFHVWLPWLGITQTGIPGFNKGRYLLGLAFFLVHLTLWHMIDFAVLASIQIAGRKPSITSSVSSTSVSNSSNPAQLVDFDKPETVLKFRLAWLARELLALPIWFVALCDNKVTWRNKRFKILSDSRAAHI